MRERSIVNDVVIKHILEEMGLFEGREVSVKEAFEKYLKCCPNGIGPLGRFKDIVALLFMLRVRIDGVDIFFYRDPPNDLLDYDPRTIDEKHHPQGL